MTREDFIRLALLMGRPTLLTTVATLTGPEGERGASRLPDVAIAELLWTLRAYRHTPVREAA